MLLKLFFLVVDLIIVSLEFYRVAEIFILHVQQLDG